MSRVSQIKEYNTNLANNLIKIDVNDYFKYIHDNFYPNQDIDFMKYFLELINSDDEFCVDHSKLNEYKVINSNDSSKIFRCLDQYELTKGEDYLITNVGEVRKTANGQNRGEVIKKKYMLTPDALKICLMRAKNSLTYATYFLLHEKNYKHYKHYNDYKLLYNNEILNQLKDQLTDEGNLLNISNFLITLLEIVEDEKRDVK